MKVTATVDTDKVAIQLESDTVTEVVWSGPDYAINDGRLSEIVNAVLKHIEFGFDREEAEIGEVVQLPSADVVA